MHRQTWIGLALLSLAVVVPIEAGLVVTVPGTANIFDAGRLASPRGDGTLPPSVTFSDGSVPYFVFNNEAGDVTFWNRAPSYGPEGSFDPGDGTYITGYSGSGLSGIAVDDRQMFLAGVFLGPTNPGAAPVNFNYTTTSPDALSFSPLLGQVFFIGDGLGTGLVAQQFFVPSGATRLFFGFADGIPGFGSSTTPMAPGQYNDNRGSISVTYDLISTPEPLSFLLVGAGIAALGLFRRRLA
jgi:PEP-CTERM motif.